MPSLPQDTNPKSHPNLPPPLPSHQRTPSHNTRTEEQTLTKTELLVRRDAKVPIPNLLRPFPPPPRPLRPQHRGPPPAPRGGIRRGRTEGLNPHLPPSFSLCSLFQFLFGFLVLGFHKGALAGVDLWLFRGFKRPKGVKYARGKGGKLGGWVCMARGYAVESRRRLVRKKCPRYGLASRAVYGTGYPWLVFPFSRSLHFNSHSDTFSIVQRSKGGSIETNNLLSTTLISEPSEASQPTSISSGQNKRQEIKHRETLPPSAGPGYQILSYSPPPLASQPFHPRTVFPLQTSSAPSVTHTHLPQSTLSSITRPPPQSPPASAPST